MRYAALIPGCAALVLGACTDTYHVNTQIGGTPAMLTSADLRLVTERPVPNNPNRRAICTEPSPDVAKALSAAVTLSANATVASGASGAGTLSGQSAEQLAELAGRIPGVVALRDGTYHLCEAWANGAIGDSAYALAISRYGELLVSLILGDGVSAATRTPPAMLMASLSGGGNSGSGGSGGAATKPAAATTPTTPTTSKAVGQLGPASDTARVQLASLTWPLSLTATAEPAALPAPPPVGADASKPASPVAAPVATATPVKNATPATTGGTTAGSDSSAGVVAAANSLALMQENYLTLGGAGPLMVACVAAGDRTTPDWMPNDVLTPRFCQGFLTSYMTSIKAAAQAKAKARAATHASTVATTVAAAGK